MDLTWGISDGEVERTIRAIVDARVASVRANVNWSDVEPDRKGELSERWLGNIDRAVAATRAAGVSVLMPFADGVPFWASADPSKHIDDAGARVWSRYWRPERFEDYADFVGRMVERYAAAGVHAFEIWNEPNFARFWPSGPDPGEYAQMLRAASAAVRAKDASGVVVLGGLSTNDHRFLAALYGAGAGGEFDVVAVHPYTGDIDPTVCWAGDDARASQHALCGIEAVHEVMSDNGDGAKAVWVTEIGWSTARAAPGVSEALQAEYLQKAFEKLATYPYVGAVYWYSLRNAYWAADDEADVEANYGLLRADFEPKPSFAAFCSSIRAHTRPRVMRLLDRRSTPPGRRGPAR